MLWRRNLFLRSVSSSRIRSYGSSRIRSHRGGVGRHRSGRISGGFFRLRFALASSEGQHAANE